MEKKIVFIAGASSGIEEGRARKLATNGYRPILSGRNVERPAAVKHELETEYHAGVCLLPFDVRDRRVAAAALDSLSEAWKMIDIPINNAGLVIGVDKEYEGSLDEWDVVIDTNVKSLPAMTRLAVPGMVERGHGHVINMGFIVDDHAYPGGSVYCATKAAVKAPSDGLCIDPVDTPVRVTNIKPGLMETNFSVARFRGDKAAADNVYKGIRLPTDDDIAEMVYFTAAVPEHMQMAEVLVMPANQATGTIVSRKQMLLRLTSRFTRTGRWNGLFRRRKRELPKCNLKD